MKHPKTIRVGGHLYRQASEDIQVQECDFASGQEPDEDSDITTVTVTFSMGGKALARLLGKQQRVLDRALKKLSDRQALGALYDADVPAEVRKAVRRLIREWYVYDLDMDAPKETMSWSDGLGSDPYPSAYIKGDKVVFEVELDVLLD